ncbi:MAG: DUF484 family protein [Methylophilaceae bacterium]|uniref:DUF484 family protein n=1 Tax=Methylovorus sp. MM2 TaxID=1848038 RepID=UPI0007E2858F|nr:DUF484 family protein [Methylovorus sp. MM2]OAM51813.1 hypothetical protein A7981_10145 [Methylovorus sp. MM2]
MEPINPLSEEQVTAFLRANPKFFERHAELLVDMYLPSTHGVGTVSLAERQQLAQRDKIRVLEAKMAEFLRYGEENDAISDKVHRLSLGLLAAQNFDILVQLLVHTLQEDFQVPHVGLRLWATPQNEAINTHPVFAPVDAELTSWTDGLVTPYCGSRPGLELDSWFGEHAAPTSFALIALRTDKVFGLLAMASEDEKRFYPEMGMLYLKRIGELVSASLLRYIDN